MCCRQALLCSCQAGISDLSSKLSYPDCVSILPPPTGFDDFGAMGAADSGGDDLGPSGYDDHVEVDSLEALVAGGVGMAAAVAGAVPEPSADMTYEDLCR